MAPTLPNGAVVPQSDGDVSISSTGVAELRALGASVDAQLGNRALVGHTHSWSQVTGKPVVFPPGPHRHGWADLDDVPDTFPPDAHEHTIDDVSGLSDALDGKVEDDDPRLSDARTPLAHTHPVTDVEGLAARLAALEYRSGIRDVSSLAGAGWSDVLATVWRAGPGVNVAVNRLGRATASSGTETVFTLPSGYRPPDTIVVRSGRGMVARILTSGAVQVIAPGVSVDYFAISFDTLQPPAISEPGDPA